MEKMASMLLPLVVIGGMMFFMTRSQKKQQNQRQEVLNSMKAGDSVVTIGGLHGVIHEINTDKDTITIDCEGIYLEFDRNAIKTTNPAALAPEPVQETAEEEVEEAVVVEEIVVEEKEENQ